MKNAATGDRLEPSWPDLPQNLGAHLTGRLLLSGVAGLKFQPAQDAAGPTLAGNILLHLEIGAVVICLPQIDVGKCRHGLRLAAPRA